MAVNVSTIKPASLKSKNVATEEYVDTGLRNIDVSSSINNNNDVFAQKLGYANFNAIVNAANSGQTLINGGYIRTSLIQAGAITANHIAANTISSDKISIGSLSALNSNLGTVTAGVIYDSSWNGSTYKMKIDLNNVEIHIV